MNDLSKNMDNFFNNLIDTMPNNSKQSNFYSYNTNKQNPSNFYKEYVENNILLLFLLTILIIIIITYFYWKNDIKKTIEKKNIIEEIPIEKENMDFIDNVDKETLMNIIDELSSVNEKQYLLQKKLKEQEQYFNNLKNQISNNNNYENYKNINNNNILNIDGVMVEAPYK